MWKKYGDQARKSGGHSGMDSIMNFRFVQLVLQGLPPDMGVYDTAEWSVRLPSFRAITQTKKRSCSIPWFSKKKIIFYW
ncbi:MAG: hypothetical protein K8R40_10895 [Anaerolineaceae bacterium]|nr:hypothetical protein [Anaerolineaceae bacterium]